MGIGGRLSGCCRIGSDLGEIIEIVPGIVGGGVARLHRFALVTKSILRGSILL